LTVIDDGSNLNVSAALTSTTWAPAVGVADGAPDAEAPEQAAVSALITVRAAGPVRGSCKGSSVFRGSGP
jgi:hypothetical protein